MNGEPEMKPREMKKKKEKKKKKRKKGRENDQMKERESTIKSKGKRKIIKICSIPYEAKSRA